MKKKNLRPLILSSLAALAMAGIGTGATFALFTDKAETTIQVGAGVIDVGLSPQSINLYSAVHDGTGEVVDENGAKYSLVEQENTFLNGGTALIDQAAISISNITPGDKINFQLNVSDASNVAYKYRLVMTASKLNEDDDDGDFATLVKNLEISLGFHDGQSGALVQQKDISGAGKYQTAWILSSETAIWGHISGSIMMPMDVGNIAQGKGAKIQFALEAVQGNAYVEGDEQTIIIGSGLYNVVHTPGSAQYVIERTDFVTGDTEQTSYILTADSLHPGLFGNGLTAGVLTKGDVVVFDDSDDPDAYSPSGKWVVNDGVTIKAKEGAHPICTVKDGPLFNLEGDASFKGIEFHGQKDVYVVTPNTLGYNSQTTPTRDEVLARYNGNVSFDHCTFVGLNSSISEENNNVDVAYGINCNLAAISVSITNSTVRNFGGYKNKDKHGMLVAGFRKHEGKNCTLTLENNVYENVYSVVDFIRSGEGLETITDAEVAAWVASGTANNVAHIAYDYQAN